MFFSEFIKFFKINKKKFSKLIKIIVSEWNSAEQRHVRCDFWIFEMWAVFSSELSYENFTLKFVDIYVTALFYLFNTKKLKKKIFKYILKLSELEGNELRCLKWTLDDRATLAGCWSKALLLVSTYTLSNLLNKNYQILVAEI